MIATVCGVHFQLLGELSFSHIPVAPWSVRGSFLGETRKKIKRALQNFMWMLSSHYPESSIITTTERRMTEELFLAGPVKLSTSLHFMSFVPTDDRRSIYRCHLCGKEDEKPRMSRHIHVFHFNMRNVCTTPSCPSLVPALQRGQDQPCEACRTT